MTLREQILAANDRKTAKVSTPEWGADIYVRTLTHSERRKLVKDNADREADTYLAGFVAAVACDEQGNRLFSQDDVTALAGKNGAVLDRIVGAFTTLNAMTPEEVEQIEKNS